MRNLRPAPECGFVRAEIPAPAGMEAWEAPSGLIAMVERGAVLYAERSATGWWLAARERIAKNA